jgi:hypothetical protein
MRVAVCINGLYRDYVNPNPEDLLRAMKLAFGRFAVLDFFYHTWEDKIQTIPLQYHSRLYTCPEPKLDYHPITDVEDSTCKHGKFVDYKRNMQFQEYAILRGKTAHASKQILGYADLISKVPQDYDMYIRARWDTGVSTLVDFTPWTKVALEQGPVGFMTRSNRGHTLHDFIQLSKNIDHTTHDHIRSSKIFPTYDDWYHYMPDILIFHAPGAFDPGKAKILHEEKNLLPAEWGWWQVMSEPYGGSIHTSVHGGAYIAR